MRVVWYEEIYIPDWLEESYNNDPEAPHYKKYEGKVIGNHSHFWTGDKLVVACTDGKVRSISQDKVTIKS